MIRPFVSFFLFQKCAAVSEPKRQERATQTFSLPHILSYHIGTKVYAGQTD
jgi:hypothetical protein